MLDAVHRRRKNKKISLFIFTKGTVEAVIKESRSERHLPATFGT
jgi:hypothetical protein